MRTEAAKLAYCQAYAWFIDCSASQSNGKYVTKIGWELAFFKSNLLKQLFSKDSIKITIFDIKSSKKEPKQVKYVN